MRKRNIKMARRAQFQWAFARPLAHRYEDSACFHPSQYARSEQTCLTAVLLKVLTYEYMHIMKLDGATVGNGGTGCFDRIIPVLAAIACHTLGRSEISYKVISEV
jgi:hypothetical protein